MIDYFFGKPRTGKTYRAVNIIYEDYIKDENSSPKFVNILTNIGGFKFKEINQTFQDRGSQSLAYKLVWKKFYEHLSAMYKMAMDDKDDAELNRYAYSHKINDCLIVLDEASLYMKKYDDVISWWLAYHGHFKIRIIIVAQSPKQINSEYLVHAEIYYEAQPQSKQLTNGKLRYIHYSDSYFSKDNKFSTDIINTKQEIYDLYKSGEVDKPKKILYKFLFFMFLSLALMIGLWKFLMYRLAPDTPDINNIQEEVTGDFENNEIENHSSNIFLNIRCDINQCWNVDDKYENNKVSLSYFKFVVLQNDLQLQYSEIKNEIYKLIQKKQGYQKITLASLTDYYYMIPKDLKSTYLSTFFIKKEPESIKKVGLNSSMDFFKDGASNTATSALARRE